MNGFKLKSFDNREIFVTVWDDVPSPKAVLQISHGVAEYAMRYAGFAEYMNSRGYIVFADDHRAHGRTVQPENLGRDAGNVFSDTLRDLIFFRSWLKNKYELPVFFLGHSYGSMLGQAFAQAGTNVRAIALTGTGYIGKIASLGAALIAPVKAVAPNWRPKIVSAVTDKAFSYKGDSGKTQWITSDKASRESYLADSLCGFPMSMGFTYYMAKETGKLYSKKNLAKLSPLTPIGLFCGREDPIGFNGKGVEKLEKLYRSYGIPVETHIYEGMRHEVLNEIGKEKPMSDIADFFDKFIVYEQTSIDIP